MRSSVVSYGKEGVSPGLKTLLVEKGKVSFENTFKSSFWYMFESTSPYSLKLLLHDLSFSDKNKGFLMF